MKTASVSKIETVEFGKYGLTGNSGLIGNCHFNAPYDCNGMVFVKTDDGWERVPKEQAKKENRKIITCSYCNKPAVSLDHCWPHLQKETVCKKHFKNERP